MSYCKLSVNINKFALVRNSRGYMPDLSQIVRDIERYGADGITVHPRPDERHITKRDVYELKNVISKEYNIEGYPTEDFIRMVEDVQPTQCTLVPDGPQQLTSDHGWDTIDKASMLNDIVSRLHASNIRVSLFIDPDQSLIEAAHDTGADRLELYTGPYAADTALLGLYATAAKWIADIGMGLNAGHDLNLSNLKNFYVSCPNLLEVSIGHALVNDAWHYGLENTVAMYRRLLVG